MRRSFGAAMLLALVLAPVLAGLSRAADCTDTEGDWRAGKAIYEKTCIACHGRNGQGARPGVPDFTTGVMAYSSDSLAAHIERGFRSPDRSLAMPPKGGNPNLGTGDIRDVLAYLRHAFGCG